MRGVVYHLHYPLSSPTQAPHTGGNKSLQPGEGSSVAARGGAHRCKGQFVAVDNSLHSGRPFCHSTILPLYHSTIKSFYPMTHEATVIQTLRSGCCGVLVRRNHFRSRCKMMSYSPSCCVPPLAPRLNSKPLAVGLAATKFSIT